MYYDRTTREIYLGDVDGYAITSPDILNLSPNNRPLIVTAYILMEN